MARFWSLWLFAAIFALGVTAAQAQTDTYHFHKEASSTPGMFQLKAAQPDSPTTAFQSIDLKNLAPTPVVVLWFDTAAGIPNKEGTIPVGSVVQFVVWLKKTSNWGVMVPQAALYLNNSLGPRLCTATGTGTVTTTLQSFSIRLVVPRSRPLRSRPPIGGLCRPA